MAQKKTYTLESALAEFTEASDFGIALRALPETDRLIAIGNLNAGVLVEINGAVMGPATKKRTVKPKQVKTYTMDTAMDQFNNESEFGIALRAMPVSHREIAVAKLNKGALDGVKVAVKAKVVSTKYSDLCTQKLRDHLLSQRVDVNEMFRKAASINKSRMIGAATLSVGDFVEVDADRSPGWNSEGGIAMVIASVTNSICAVK